MAEEREASLDEWMDKLSRFHRARKELDGERATNKALVEALDDLMNCCGARGTYDARKYIDASQVRSRPQACQRRVDRS